MRHQLLDRVICVCLLSLLLSIPASAATQATTDPKIPVPYVKIDADALAGTGLRARLTRPDMNPIRADQTAVILIHGTAAKQTTWADMCDAIHSHYPQAEVYAFSYDSSQPIDDNARLLGDFINLYSKPGGELEGRNFVIVAHSMGGLVARGYIEKHGGAPRLLRLITLGTPHEGTPIADPAWVDAAFPGNCPDLTSTCGAAKCFYRLWLQGKGVLYDSKGVLVLQSHFLDKLDSEVRGSDC